MTFSDIEVGKTFGPVTRSWTSTDAIIYALGVGAGQEPERELAFTTENSKDVQHQALPTFAVVLSKAPQLRAPVPSELMHKAVHAEQQLTLHRPVPVEGTVELRGQVTGVYDKGSGALITTRTDAHDADTQELMFSTGSAVFVRGEGGFGGDRGPSSPWELPERAPDEKITYETRPEQALLYRLSGDRNPLHSDPFFAQRAGFSRPILHGLATYGFAGRALLETLCGGDAARFRAMGARFTSPTLPGDPLTVKIWADGTDARFRVEGSSGDVILDRGSFARHP